MKNEVEIYDGLGMIANGNSNQGNVDFSVSGGDSQLPYTSEISKMVIDSEPYKSAYLILSAEPDKSWLQELERIPYMVQDAPETWFDKHNWTNNAEDKQNANYQYCMERISALMADYRTWKNSLPSTQVEQQSVIGYNSAITGQNIGSSSIPNVGVSTNPAALESTNNVEVFGSAISTASSLLSSVSGGALSWFNAFTQISQYVRSQNLAERQAEQSINNAQLANNVTLAEKGAQGIPGTYGHEQLEYTDISLASAAKARVEAKKAILEDYTTFNPPPPIEGSEIQEVYNKIANLKFDLIKKRLGVEGLKLDYESKLHQYNSGYLTDDPESFGASKSKYEKSQYEYDAYVKTRTLELLQDMSDKSAKGSIVHTFMLDNILTGLDIKTLAVLSAGNAAQPIAETILDKLGVDINL